MKIFILSVPFEFQPSARKTIYLRHNKKDYGIEQDFLDWLKQNPELIVDRPDIADWHYLPVYWTRYHLCHQYGRTGRGFLQRQVSERILDEGRTFTICQYANGPMIDLGKTVQFLASRKEQGIDVPLICYPHEIPSPKPAKKWLASFAGKLHTHPIRSTMRQQLGRRGDINILNVPHHGKSPAFFVNQMLQSYAALCPRGYGCTSFRFYEAMQIGIVPIFISDIDNRPFKAFLNWDRVSFYTESVEGAKDILDSHPTRELLQMGKSAKVTWYQDLTFGKWCKYVLKELRTLR